MIPRILCVFLALFALHATAEVKVLPMPGDTKLVVFPYDPNNTYTILTRPRNVTDISLQPNEEVVAMALGETTQWIVTDAPGHVFIKPIYPDIVTSGTLVTNKRTYQLSLRSSPEDGKFYQRVSWDYPEMLVLRAQHAMEVKSVVDNERARIEASVLTPAMNVEQLNFDYAIEGEADWRPVQVFDDGRATWIRLRKSQDSPVIFALGEEDKLELLNTNARGEYVVIQRILPKILLRLGKTDVRVINTRIAPRKTWVPPLFGGGA